MIIVIDLSVLEQYSTKRFMEKLFMSNGFRVNEISYSEVATSLGKVISPCDYKYALFVSEQLRFSDDQVQFFL